MLPRGFPFLVGLTYLTFGVSDLAAICVSVLAGTLTIPATAWLARRTFGAGAGAAAAALVALSGFHVAFSRMALTDASFLLFWVLGLICGQRFLERPGVTRRVALGLAVGLAQFFKYNGWLLGAIVVLAACLGSIVDPRKRDRAKAPCNLGTSGLLAALLAAAIYWPWFRFVESHGGYRRLLAHHRSYMGGLGSWLPHWRLQLEQASALSGGPVWNTVQYALVIACFCLMVPPRRRNRSLAVAPGCSASWAHPLPASSSTGSSGRLWMLRPRQWTPGDGSWPVPGWACRSSRRFIIPTRASGCRSSTWAG